MLARGISSPFCAPPPASMCAPCANATQIKEAHLELHNGMHETPFGAMEAYARISELNTAAVPYRRARPSPSKESRDCPPFVLAALVSHEVLQVAHCDT